MTRKDITFQSNQASELTLVLREGLGVLVLRDGGDVPVQRQQLLHSGLSSLVRSPVVPREQIKAGPEPRQLPRLSSLPVLWDGVQQRT